MLCKHFVPLSKIVASIITLLLGNCLQPLGSLSILHGCNLLTHHGTITHGPHQAPTLPSQGGAQTLRATDQQPYHQVSILFNILTFKTECIIPLMYIFMLNVHRHKLYLFSIYPWLEFSETSQIRSHLLPLKSELYFEVIYSEVNFSTFVHTSVLVTYIVILEVTTRPVRFYSSLYDCAKTRHIQSCNHVL